jgi:hypothetical protein
MLDRLNQVSVGAEQPDFVTLTFPDNCFEDSVSSFGKTAKLHLDTFLKRLRRACPSACGFWRMEWKARKSGLHEGKLFPHFHLLVWGMPQRDLGTEFSESFVPVRDCQQSFTSLCAEVLASQVWASEGSAETFAVRACRHEYRVAEADSIGVRRGVEHTYMSFFDWVSLAWYHVVGTGNVEHFLAGCRVERIRTWRGVLSYCAKYMSKADSENFLADEAVGRSWGIFNRGCMPWAKMIELPLDDEVGIRVRRVACRYLERRLGRRVQRHYGVTVYCDPAQWAGLWRAPPDAPF